MAAQFFPSGCFSSDPNVDSIWQKLYSYRLEAARETPLCLRKIEGPATVCRFFFSEGVGVIVRIEHTDESTELVAKQLDLKEPGSIHEAVWSFTEHRRPLLAPDWIKVANLINACDYWNMPSEPNLDGLDGFHCIVEVAQYDRYHIVDRWCPCNDQFAELCEALLRFWELTVGRRIGPAYHLHSPWWRFW